MADNLPWQPLLREALAVLALRAEEQVRVNGPGCVACDLLNDFDNARRVAVGNAPEKLSDEQRTLLKTIDNIMESMQAQDYECFNNEVLHRPVWQRLRELAAEGLSIFGWPTTAVAPFVEVEPGVWRRSPDNAEP